MMMLKSLTWRARVTHCEIIIHWSDEAFIGKLLRDYYRVDGRPLDERNPKYLQDD